MSTDEQVSEQARVPWCPLPDRPCSSPMCALTAEVNDCVTAVRQHADAISIANGEPTLTEYLISQDIEQRQKRHDPSAHEQDSTESGEVDRVALLLMDTWQRVDEPVGVSEPTHLPGCILEPDHGAGCVREQFAVSDPAAPWNEHRCRVIHCDGTRLGHDLAVEFPNESQRFADAMDRLRDRPAPEAQSSVSGECLDCYAGEGVCEECPAATPDLRTRPGERT